YARLVLTNGARLSLSAATLERHTLHGTTLFGARVEIPLDQLLALDILQGKAVYLSDLKPKAYRHTPFLNVSWPYVVDGSVAGRDMRLAGSTYDRGLGMHSQSEITYALPGAYRRFEALVGLDEETGRQGSVRVKVLVDGKPRDFGWDKELTARDGPQK